MDAEAVVEAKTVASEPADRAMPRRARRARSIWRARASLAADRSPGPAKQPGRLIGGLALQIAKDQRDAVLVRQPLEFFIQHAPQVAREDIRSRVRGGHLADLPFMSLPPDALGACFARDPISNSVKPAGQGVLLADGPSFADQYQERRLKGVFGVVPVAEQPPAQGQDHRPMPLYELGKGGTIPSSDEGFQQRFIRHSIWIGQARQLADAPDHEIELAVRHGCGSLGRSVVLYIVAGRKHSYTTFSKDSGGSRISQKVGHPCIRFRSHDALIETDP
jgi:hypothetical protein